MWRHVSTNRMISIKNLTLSYTKKKILSNINIEINDGDFIVITGPNGGGKSTLLYTINGVIPHIIQAKISGAVVLNNLDVNKHSVSSLSKTVGLLLQDPDSQLFTSDVEAEIAFPLENAAKERSEIRKRVEELLPITGLPRTKEIWSLSEGQKQKLAIATILALDPNVLLLDEPTAELDQKGKEEVYKILEKLNKSGKTIIVVEHNTRLAMKFADRAIVLDKKVIYDGPPKIFHDRKWCYGVGVEPLDTKEQITEAIGQQVRKNKKAVSPTVATGNISAGYEKTLVFRNLSLSVDRGEFLVIQGPTGSGKTTLLKHLNGLKKPDSGTIMLFGRNIKDLTRRELAINTSFLFQNPEYQIFKKTVEEEISFTMRRCDAYNKANIDDITNTFKIRNLLTTNPHTLSHGQKQLISLISSLTLNPKLILLDEPTAYLDYKTKLKLLKKLSELKKRGKTIIVVTHDLISFTPLADRVLSLSDGKLK